MQEYRFTEGAKKIIEEMATPEGFKKHMEDAHKRNLLEIEEEKFYKDKGIKIPPKNMGDRINRQIRNGNKKLAKFLMEEIEKDDNFIPTENGIAIKDGYAEYLRQKVEELCHWRYD